MPLYEYECQQCRRRTEKIQKFSDAPLTECPHCSGHLERLIHPPAVSFKGGGWYADLYSSAKPSGSGEAKTGTGTAAGASDGSATSSASTSNAPAPSSAPASPASSTSSDKK